MQEEFVNNTPEAELLNLGVMLGKNQALGLVIGHCSAEQAATLERIREERRYRCCAATWREFCTEYLKISGAEADRAIRLYQDFGRSYFEVARLTRISADTFRLIEPHLRDGALHHQGEAIALIPENARKVSAAVARIRNAAPRRTPKPLEAHERIAALDRRWTAMRAEFEEISRKERCGENWLRFTSLLTRIRSELARLELANGL